MLKRTRASVAGVALAAMAFGGCSSDDDKDSAETTASTAAAETTAAPAAAAGAELTIEGFAFSGGPFTANEPITITNKDSAPHTVSADDESFEAEVAASGTATLTVTAPGEYTIHCDIHPQMSGTITVN